MQSSLSVGDEIVLTSGVFGTISQVEDDHVLVEIAPGVAIKVARGAVGTIATKVDQPDDQDQLDQNEEPGAAESSEEN